MRPFNHPERSALRARIARDCQLAEMRGARAARAYLDRQQPRSYLRMQLVLIACLTIGALSIGYQLL